ncbi:MAG: hypothetical protein BMS9Abin37_1352 [Acidobacteriota bacterium]|nr:MAG: hypothetical protein BMS9Abin37_1352 [Acidobacteriota bacterium]
MSERTTADPVPEDQLRGDVDQVMQAIARGGVALVPLDIAYAIIAATPQGIRKIFDAKNRSYDKPSGMFANWEMSAEIHILEEEKRRMIREVVEEEKIPFSVVAPFRGDHPLLQAADPFVLDASSKAGTLDMLLNAGQFHDEIARQSVLRNLPVFGSSANTSLTGSKYRLADIDAPVREAGDVAFDYGRSMYANENGLSSTIIDFRDFSIVRRGVVFDRLEAVFRDRFGVELSA